MNKIKFGTTVEVATPDRIKELRSKNPESIRSTGEAIDYLTAMFTINHRTHFHPKSVTVVTVFSAYPHLPLFRGNL